METRRTALKQMAGALALGVGGLSLEQATVQAQAPKRGGTLVFAISAETPHYDPHGSDTYATLHFAAPFYSTLLRFNLSKFPEVEGDLAQSWTVAPDLMTYTFKLHPEREVRRRHGAHFSRREGDLRSTAQSADRRRLHAQGDLRRHRHDRDARSAHGRVQDEGDQRVDARALRLAVERHLCGEGSRGRSGFAAHQDQRHRPVHLRRARQGQPRRRQEERQLFQAGPALSRRLEGRVHAAGGRDAQRLAGRTGARRIPRHLAGRARPADCGHGRQASGSRNRAGRSICSLPSTSRRSRSTTCACAARCCWRSTAGAAARASRASRRCARLAASSAPARPTRRRKRSWSSCPASPRTSRRRAPRPSGCLRRRAFRTSISRCGTATWPCPTRRPASSWSISGGRSGSPSSTSSPTPGHISPP